MECSCGKFYESKTGVKLCQHNGHGSGKNDFNSKRRFLHTIETEIQVEYTECGEPLRFEITTDNGYIRIEVLPHICQIAAPEEDAAA